MADNSTASNDAKKPEKTKKEKKSRPKDIDSEQDGVTERKPRKKIKERSSNLDVKLQDVTNSPRPLAREALSPIEISGGKTSLF